MLFIRFGVDFLEYSLSRVAEKFGISKTAVSLILNGKAEENRISPELAKRVKEFCDEVNYVPNIHAKRMRKKIVGNIGLLINEDMLFGSKNPFSDQIVSEIVGGVVIAAQRSGFRTTVQLYNSSMKEDKIFDWLRDKEIDGLIYYGSFLDENWIRAFTEEKRSVVGIGIMPFDKVSTVNINNRQIMYKVCQDILKKGRKDFTFVSGGDSYVSMERYLGLVDAVEDYGLDKENIKVIDAHFSYKRAYEIFKDISIDFDAVVCANDYMAIGVLRALTERNIKIPEEISLCGADNIRSVHYVSPQITTIDNMSTELGKTSFSELLKLIKGKDTRTVFLESKIIVGKSI